MAVTGPRRVSLSVPVDTEIEVEIELPDFVDALDEKDRAELLRLLRVPDTATQEEFKTVGDAVFYDYYGGKLEVTDNLRRLIELTAGRIL